MKLILRAFWHRFWDDFRRPGNVKNDGFVEEGCIFLRFWALKDEMLFWMRFGWVWGRALEAFCTFLSGCRGFEKESKFEPEVENRKSGSRSARGG